MKNLFNVSLKAFLSLALILTFAFNAHAQNDPLGPLSSITEFTILPGHDLQFQEGVKAWKACYMAENGEWTWSIWQRQQGEGNVYVLATNMPNWAEMDKTDPVGSKCAALATAMINAHVEKASNHITRLLPAVSNSNPNADELISVGFYELNPRDGHKFLPVIKEVAASYAKAKGSPIGYWYSWMTGGPESPNYHVVTPFKNYAAMDVTRDSVWDVYEKEHGKEKRDAMQAQFRSALDNTWSYQYKLNVEMSRPTK